MLRTCERCGKSFEPRFSQQLERRANAAGEPEVSSAYCSAACLLESRDEGSDASCDACGVRFVLEYAAQLLSLGGRRRHACSPECRAALLAGTAPRDLRAGTPPPQAPREAPGPLPFPARRARVVAVFNHKGGTGKTTTSVTLASGLARRGQRVLLVDTDAQGNVAVSLGVRAERTLYHVLVMGLDPGQATQEAAPGLDVLASNETLAAAELYLAGRRARDRVLADRLAPVRGRYDFVIVDCSPSLSLLNQNALCFADGVVCPVACDYLSLVGVRQVVRTLRHVNQLLGHPVKLWGVLPTLFDARARICHEALASLRAHFGEACLPPVRVASKVKEAPAEGKSLFDHAPQSSAAEDYRGVVEWMLRVAGRGRTAEPAYSPTPPPATVLGGAA